MAGLETYDTNTPAGASNINLGDDKLRELAQKLAESFSLEHGLNGKHAIVTGTTGQRPAAGTAGRFYILKNAGVNAELQYDDGTQWVTLTNNTSTVASDLATHQAASTIDHPDSSITKVKMADDSVGTDEIEDGSVLKRHLDAASGDPTGSLASLVNGAEVDSSWHTHPTAAAGAVTFLDPIANVNSGSGDVGWTNYDASGDIPGGAVGVILQARGNMSLNLYASETKQPNIDIRKDSGSDTLWLVGGSVTHGADVSGISEFQHRGQGVFPVDSNRKFQYRVSNYDVSWRIDIIGYF